MTDPSHPSQPGLLGRLKETVKGASEGIKHAMNIMIGRVAGEAQAPYPNKVHPPVRKLNSGLKEMATMPDLPKSNSAGSSAGKNTFIYEQCSIDGNQSGSLRALGHARETDRNSSSVVRRL